MSAVPRLRLDRLLANLGYGSRKATRSMIAGGSVTLKGVPLLDPEMRLTLDPELGLHILVDGEPLDPLPGLVLMMNKPTGLSCSRKDPGGIVYELLPERWQQRDPALSTVGRLDKETSGLLLFTDDGQLLHRITAPKREIPKRYLAELEHPLRGDEAELFASGTLLLEGEERPLLPARFEVHTPTSASITITEGRYHQVRRMLVAAGNSALKLHRTSIGGLTLPADLLEGQHRVLSKRELESVFMGIV